MAATTSFQNRKCLVTGGAGFIGSNLALRLVELGAHVAILDSLAEGMGGNTFNLRSIEGKAAFHVGDQRDPAILEQLIPGQDFIFNLAGNVSHQDSMKMPLVDLDSNVTAHLLLLEACRRHNRDAVIVYSGTRQLYGVPQYLPVDENHPVAPVDVNGIHKFAGDHYHTLYARAHGLKTVVLRLTNTYGPRQLIKHARQGFIGWFMNRAVTGNTIHLFGTGKQLRDFTAVQDVVEAMLLAAQTEACLGQAFNLSGERADLETVARLLVKIAGSCTFERVPFPPDAATIEIGDFYGTSEKFRKVTGWEPVTSLEAGLCQMFAYYRANQTRYLPGCT